MNALEKAQAIHRLTTISEIGLEIDFSRFDRSLSTKLLEHTEHAIYRRCLPSAISQMMTLQLKNYVRTRNNAVYMIDGTRMSGDVNTSIGNCLVNACLIRSLGIKLTQVKIEGDDMLAAVTKAQRDQLDLDILRKAGTDPVARVLPIDEAEFCSRRLIFTPHGPRLCRDPRREIRRTGYSIHGETEMEKLERGIQEWEGLPMFGPLYQSRANIRITPVSAETRISFAKAWEISQDEQRKFEEDPEFRETFAEEIAAPDATPTGDRYRPLQRTLDVGPRRHIPVPVCSRIKRTTPSGCQRQDVRDVPPARSSQGTVPSGSRDNDKRGSAHGRRLRRKRLRAVLQRHGGTESQGNVTRVERQHPQHTTRP